MRLPVARRGCTFPLDQMTMRRSPFALACLALIMTGCQHTSPRQEISHGPDRTPGQSGVVDLCSGHRSIYGPWAVTVTGPDGGLHVTRLTETGGATISTTTWAATEAAFLFVESGDRIWAFDGDDDLFMLQAGPSTLTSYGPHTFPVAPPTEVITRLPAGFRSQLRVNGL
jgi:hypothetical protein